MVNLLYFQGLVFLVLPYAPLATIIILMFQFLTFKFEKMMLFKFGTKPKKEWKAQDAGAFFIKFYLITIVVTGLLSTYIFVSSTTFAKSEKQLVESVTYCTELETVTDACTVYTLERLQNISKYKCGPFVNETSAWAMVSTGENGKKPEQHSDDDEHRRHLYMSANLSLFMPPRFACRRYFLVRPHISDYLRDRCERNHCLVPRALLLPQVQFRR